MGQAIENCRSQLFVPFCSFGEALRQKRVRSLHSDSGQGGDCIDRYRANVTVTCSIHQAECADGMGASHQYALEHSVSKVVLVGFIEIDRAHFLRVYRVDSGTAVLRFPRVPKGNAVHCKYLDY